MIRKDFLKRRFSVNVNLLSLHSVDQINGTEFFTINSIKKILVENKVQSTGQAVYIFKDFFETFMIVEVV